ncbi:MAG: hypothetical protein JWN36_2150 [Microbacteriaceae bacterium]|nr:hypothetical protein [Microbacteriaceae bacterium]
MDELTALHRLRDDEGPDAVALALGRARLMEAATGSRAARWNRRTVIASIAAFSLAGALTGGAVSAVALTRGDPGPSVLYRQALSYVGQGTAYGTPFEFEGSGDAAVALGIAPPGATEVMLVVDCRTGADIDVRVDGALTQGGKCSGSGGGATTVAGRGSHTLTVTAHDSRRYGVLALWMKEAPLPPRSAAQLAALADGVVTHDEYIAGYNRFAGCLTAEGYPMEPTDPAYLETYGAVVSGAVDSGADARCYRSEFDQIDSDWQIHVSAVLDACLAAHGVVVTPFWNVADKQEHLYPFHLTFAQCEAAGYGAQK